jgi:predicted nucleic acid-binding Zn finger protein
MNDIVIKPVPSKTNPDKVYYLKLLKNNNFWAIECSCPAFLMKNPTKLPCKHMIEENERIELPIDYPNKT